MGVLSDILFPPKCVLCGKVLSRGETDLCKPCRIDGPECPPGKQKLQFLDSWTSVWYYEGNVRKSLLGYKFRGRRNFAAPYGRLLAVKLLREQPEGFDCITWVPTGRLRKLLRGYDQVELLAKTVGQELGMEPRRLLRKRRDNPPQSRISGYAKRKANVLGAYQAVDTEYIQGKRILLLDDILTTGATAGECARVLLTAGASQIHCGVVAAARKHK